MCTLIYVHLLTCMYVYVLTDLVYKQVYIEKKKYPYDCFMVSSIQQSVIMTNFIMLETQQPIIVNVLIIHSLHLLKNLVELKEYISGGIVSY